MRRVSEVGQFFNLRLLLFFILLGFVSRVILLNVSFIRQGGIQVFLWWAWFCLERIFRVGGIYRFFERFRNVFGLVCVRICLVSIFLQSGYQVRVGIACWGLRLRFLYYGFVFRFFYCGFIRKFCRFFFQDVKDYFIVLFWLELFSFFVWSIRVVFFLGIQLLVRDNRLFFIRQLEGFYQNLGVSRCFFFLGFSSGFVFQ